MRRTGRTTRMIEAAIESARTGKAVYVICAYAEAAKKLRSECPHAVSLGVKFETWESLGNLHPVYLTLQGAWPNVMVLADHHAIETRYATILEMWQRFDKPKPAAREKLTEVYLDYFNNYLTTEKYAEDNGLTPEQGLALINLAREVARSPHPES